MIFLVSNRNTGRKAGFIGVALLALASCTSQPSLTGAGATFPNPLYAKWFDAYQAVGHIEINYQANGSGGGIKAVTEGTVDFGASDMPLTDEQMRVFKEKRGYNILQLPTVLGAAVPTYNVPGVKQDLVFTPDVLAGIFIGTIKAWNDPRIAKANPGTALPSKEIVVVHRSDGSGTTYVWTDYLSKVSPEWKSRVGRNSSVEWPVGLGAKGNDGVAGLIAHQEGGCSGWFRQPYSGRFQAIADRHRGKRFVSYLYFHVAADSRREHRSSIAARTQKISCMGCYKGARNG
jgi:phosphate transport system substrate-binding protein